MNLASRRVSSELRFYHMDSSDVEGIRIEVLNDNNLTLKGFIKGVKGTPYETGEWELDINISESYPYKAPKIKFVTKIWHPSVNPFDGTVCLPGTELGSWPVSMTIYKTLISIQSWLSNYNVKEPVDVEILEQALKKSDIFTTTAQFWTTKYAGGKKPLNRECRDKVQLVSHLTNSEELAIVALSYHSWSLPNDIFNYVPQR